MEVTIEEAMSEMQRLFPKEFQIAFLTTKVKKQEMLIKELQKTPEK